ncbi:hypothetical protein QFC21_005201 [Naganishia friedmannii]|uniref:Uncharacterized protein n=1 Tax=Naganishia friedmannii TaxID=89922 RepID=A0ACC2VB33_9TREE|nr:hypothetical protein QFC21_005201 [Naganishia friedmannii]
MYRTPDGSSGGVGIPSTASSTSSIFPRTLARGLTPAQQPIHQIPPFPPLLPTTTITARRRKEKSKNIVEPESMTVQQAIILSQLFPEEWALLHPIYGGQGVTALSLQSLPSPESLPISPPGEGFAELDLDVRDKINAGLVGGEKEGGLPSIKDVLGEEFQWINWNHTTTVSPTPFSPGCTHSANNDGLTLPPILHSDSSDDEINNHGNGMTTASTFQPIHQLGPEQLHSVSKTIVIYPNSPPSTEHQPLLTDNAHHHDGRLPPPLSTLCIPPPPLDLKNNDNYHHPYDTDRLSPLTTMTQKQRYHPYNRSPLLYSPSSAGGSQTFRATVSFRAGGGINSPLSADGMKTGFNLRGFEEESGSAQDKSRVERRGGKVGMRNGQDQCALPGVRPVPPVAVVARNWKSSVRHSLTSNKLFVKEKRGGDDPGQGGYWRLATLEDGVDATKMLLSRHGGRNMLPGRCVPTPVIGGGTLQRLKGQHQTQQMQQKGPMQQLQHKKQKQSAILRRQEEEQKQAAMLRQQEEKQKQAAIQKQKHVAIQQKPTEKQKPAVQKYRFAKPLFQDSFGRK